MSSWAKVTLTLEVDSSDVDLDNRTGLTAAAFDRLSEAVERAGFQILDGPDLMEGGGGRVDIYQDPGRM